MIARVTTVLLLVVLALCPSLAVAQGVTTASINGTVTDTNGDPLPGASVVAVHTPSGTQYGTATRLDGRYNLPDVRVGGPYTVTVSFVGFRTRTENIPALALSQDLTLDFTLQDDAQTLEEVLVVATKDEVLNADRTGAATNVNTTQIQRLPTLSRAVSDFTRLSPQSTGFNSFGGRNNLYNNLSLDGSVFNNVFGLASEVGGQANAQPISLDAVEEIQVAVAPYDVRQGSFTGAGINVITKAGTNEFKGSAYTYRRNESLISEKVEDVDVTNTSFTQSLIGGSISGPILKNKLFLFANGEFGRRDDPGSTFLASRGGSTGANISGVRAEDLDLVKSTLQSQFGFDPGTYEGYSLDTYNDKFTARLDYNLARNHRLTFRYNYLKSYRDVLPSNSGASGTRQPGPTSLPFNGSTYRINNNLNSFIAQLNSTFSNKYSNVFIVGFSAFRDFRSAPISIFPLTDIENGAGSTITTFGYEPFTPNNKLDTDVFQISNSFTAYLGDHTVTVGTAHEAYAFSNGFTPNFYGRFRFRSVSDFIAHVTAPDPTAAGVPQPSQFEQTYSAVAGVPVPLAEISAIQSAAYLQDEFKILDNVKITFGVRVDVPFFTKDLPSNTIVDGLTFAGGERLDVSRLPDANPLFSPRLGFNWDARGDRSLQVRGGTGVFTGKIPFVWISNQASNNGVLFGTTFVSASSSAAATTPLLFPGTNEQIVFSDDVTAYVPDNPTAPPTFLVNATTDEFKFPQVWRSNLALDTQLPWGMVGTLEGIYTKDLNAIFHRDANFKDAIGTFAGADNRPRFAGSSSSVRINSQVTNAIVLDNTSEGYQYSLTAQLQKAFSRGLFASVAYTNSKARDLTSSPSAIAATAWRSNQIVNNPNVSALGFAANDLRHRIVAFASYKLEYLGLAGTTLSAIYTGNTGFNYSYVYSGDMNGDGVVGNDLMYVPRNASEIVLLPTNSSDTRTPEQIWQQLDAFIAQDPYLSERRGGYAERGAATAPWVNRFDISVRHEFFTNLGGARRSVEVSFDLQNVGNLFNASWGLQKLTNTTQPVAAAGTRSDGTPQFRFPLVSGAPLATTFRTDTGIGSRWQAQFGIRVAL
jgi:hypothetical protein